MKHVEIDRGTPNVGTYSAIVAMNRHFASLKPLITGGTAQKLTDRSRNAVPPIPIKQAVGSITIETGTGFSYL